MELAQPGSGRYGVRRERGSVQVHVPVSAPRGAPLQAFATQEGPYKVNPRIPPQTPAEPSYLDRI